MLRFYRIFLFTALLLTGSASLSTAQYFSTGPIPMCDTSYFTCNVFGIGQLGAPGTFWAFTMNSIGINITSNHPQTLVISLTSPQGTTLLLSAYNGNGGSNYTGCTFNYSGFPLITTGTAPFTGAWTAQGGSLSIFDGQNADGTWTITVIDTACASGGSGPGGPWTSGFFNGAAGFDFEYNPAPCMGFIPTSQADICQGSSFDILNFYNSYNNFLIYTISQGGFNVANPSAVSAAGTYDVYGWDFSCNYWGTFTINVLPQITLGSDQVVNVCHDAPVNLSSLYPIGGITALWSLNGTPLTPGTETAATATGTYQLIGQNAAGCNDTALVTVNNISTTFLGADNNIMDCGGTGIFDVESLYNTAGMPYTWYFGMNTVTNPSAVSGDGIYSVIAYDANNCTDTAFVNISYASNTFLGVDLSQSICAYSSIDLTSLYTTTGTVSNWTFNGSPIVNPSSVNTSGVYKLVATSATGCTDSATVTLNILPTPTLGTDQIHSICANTFLNLSSQYTTTGYVSNWSYNSAPVVNPTAVNSSGIYTLIVTSANGCQDTAAITLSTMAVPTLGIDQTTNLCANAAIDLSSLFITSGSLTNWTLNGSAVANPNSINSGGTYMLIATSANTCSDTALVTVNIQPAPTLGMDQSINNCANTTQDLTLLYATTGFITDWTYNNAPVINPAAVGASGIYTLIATTVSGCTDTADVTVNVLPIPALGTDQSMAICSNSLLDLTSLYTTTGSNASWSFNNLPVLNPAAVNTSGIYTLIALSVNGCSDTAEVNLNVLAAPILGPDQSQIICANSNLNLTTLYTTTGYAVNWTSGGSPVIDPTSVNAAGNYQIFVADLSGCTNTANVSLQLNAVPVLGTDLTEVLCSGTSMDLTGLFSLTGLNTNWTENGNPVPDPANIIASATIQLIAGNANGCVDTAFVTVNELTGPNLGPDQTYVLCQWMTVDLSSLFNLTGLTSNYLFNGTAISNYTAVYDSGSYVIVSTDANGCSDQALVTIENQNCLCVADFRFAANCIEDPVTFEIIADSAIVGAHWKFDNSALHDLYEINPTVKFSNEDLQIVTMEAELSCGTVIVQKSLQVKYCADSCNIFFPEAFTPNGDGKNEQFAWYTECNTEEFQLQISNRFGQVVFRSDNPNSSWDGNYNGHLAPAGVYVLYTKYKLPYKDVQERTKKLTLLR